MGVGAVVTKDVPDQALMVGNPGKKIGWMCFVVVDSMKICAETNAASLSMRPFTWALLHKRDLVKRSKRSIR